MKLTTIIQSKMKTLTKAEKSMVKGGSTDGLIIIDHTIM